MILLTERGARVGAVLLGKVTQKLEKTLPCGIGQNVGEGYSLFDSHNIRT